MARQQPGTGRGAKQAPAARLTLAVGTDDFLAERAISAVWAAARAADPDADRVRISATDDGAATRLAQAAAPTLFGGGSVIVVEHAEEADDGFLEALVALAAEVSAGDAHWLVVVHAGQARGRKVRDRIAAMDAGLVDCAPVKRGRSTVEFVRSEFASRRRQIDPDAVMLLAEAIGPDTRGLAAAVAQLSSDIPGDAITAEDVTRYFPGVAEVTGFQIADAVLNRQPVEVVRALRQAAHGDSGRLGPVTVKAVNMAIRQVTAVCSIAPGMSDRDIASAAKVPPWKVGTLRSQGRHWGPDSLSSALVRLVAADAAGKGGMRPGEVLDPAQKNLALERTLVELATAPRPGDEDD